MKISRTIAHDPAESRIIRFFALHILPAICIVTRMNTKNTQTSSHPPCDICGGKCCKYVSVQIDTPVEKDEWDNIRWYLLHENVRVFIDHDMDWFIEFLTPCTAQLPDNRCGCYETRPAICRSHGQQEDVNCEYYADPYHRLFETVEQLELYLINEHTC